MATAGVTLMAVGIEVARRLASRRRAELEKENEELRREIDALNKVAGQGVLGGSASDVVTRALGNVRGVNGMNRALWAMKAFVHEPPHFEYFDPVLTEQMCVMFKEIRLPMAEQTHELCFEPVSRSLFVTQMSNSVLVRIPVGARGLILDDQDAWRIGPADKFGNGISGLHNVSLSHRNPGCLWLTLQSSNTLLLVEATTMKLRRIIKCPTLLKRPDNTAALVGGPHCLRECPLTGDVWVALKGSVGCHPGEIPGLAEASGKTGFALAKERVCCDPKALRKRMNELNDMGTTRRPRRVSLFGSLTRTITIQTRTRTAVSYTRHNLALPWSPSTRPETVGSVRINRRRFFACRVDLRLRNTRRRRIKNLLFI